MKVVESRCKMDDSKNNDNNNVMNQLCYIQPSTAKEARNPKFGFFQRFRPVSHTFFPILLKPFQTFTNP